MGASVTIKGMDGARAAVRRAVAGFRRIASGAAANEAGAEIAARMDAEQRAFLAKHSRSGNALASLRVEARGGLVRSSSVEYVKYLRGYPRSFRDVAQQAIVNAIRRALGVT